MIGRRCTTYIEQLSVEDIPSSTTPDRMSALATVEIRIREVNEAPILVVTDVYIAENAPLYAYVGPRLADMTTEPDIFSRQKFSFRIDAGNEQGLWEIEECSGQISLKVPLNEDGARMHRSDVDPRIHSMLNFESKITEWTLTITVADNGEGSLSDTGDVTIRLTDINEHPYLDSASLTVPEMSPKGTVVGTMKAHDLDRGDVLFFSITGGNTPSEVFRIDSSSGILTVLNAGTSWKPILDFETQIDSKDPVYNLRVTVKDSGSLTTSALCVVTVTNVPEAPLFAFHEHRLNENSPPGTPVGSQMTGWDSDRGDTAELKYSITNGDPLGFFNIARVGSDRGQLFVAQNALRWPSCRLSKIERANVKAALGDESYRGKKACMKLCQSIRSCSEETCRTECIRDQEGNFLNQLDFEGEINVFRLTIQVEDRTSTPLVGEGSVVIRLSNVMEPPSYPDSIRIIPENSPRGTKLGSPIISDDEDARDRPIYSIVSQKVFVEQKWLDTSAALGTDCFVVHALSGQLSLKYDRLDYEWFYLFEVLLKSTDRSGLEGFSVVTVKVTNVDEVPVFIEVPQLGCPPGWQTDGAGMCCDKLAGCTGRCAIANVDVSSSSPSCADYRDTMVSLRVTPWAATGPLSKVRGCAFYERTGKQNGPCRLTADAVDHPDIDPGRICTLTKDRTCNSPFISGMTASVDSETECIQFCREQRFGVSRGCQYMKATRICGITESCSLSSAATSWAAKCEVGRGRLLSYSIVKGDNGNIWDIEESTGLLRPRLPLIIDFENEYTNNFELTIQAKDEIGLKTSTIFHVRIDDLNEAPRWANTFKGAVKEVQPTGWEFGATVKAYDPDFEYIKTTVNWWGSRTSSSCVEKSRENIRLGHGCEAGFIEGIITWKEFGSWEFDFITSPAPNGDVEDSVLFKSKNRFGKWVEMALQNGKKRRELPVTASISKKFFYRLEFSSPNTIGDKHMQVLGGESAVSRVNQGRYLQFVIVDGNYGGVGGAGTEGVHDVFRINNFNDGTCKIAVNKGCAASFGERDCWSPSGCPGSCAMVYDIKPEYTLTIRAVDPPGLYADGTYTVEVIPGNIPPVCYTTSWVVRENFGGRLYKSCPKHQKNCDEIQTWVFGKNRDVWDIDISIGRKQTLSYYIVGGDHNRWGNRAYRFRMNNANGEVTAGGFNYEYQSYFDLRIRVVDTGVGRMSNDCIMFVTIVDVNDRPWVWGRWYKVSENTRIGTTIGSRFDVGDWDHYDGYGGKVGNFRMGSQNVPFGVTTGGQLYVNNPVDPRLRPNDGLSLNFEYHDIWHLSLCVEDSGWDWQGKLIGCGGATIFMFNNNDCPLIYDETRELFENTVARPLDEGEVVGETLRCIPTICDEDALDFGSYVITGCRPGQCPFKMNKRGQIMVANPGLIDYEVRKQYEIDVKYTDKGGSRTGRKCSDSAKITINVINLNEKPRFSPLSDGVRYVNENSEGGDLAGKKFRASDPEIDSGQSQTLTYSVAGQPNRFAIETVGKREGQLVVVQGASLNFEEESSFVVVVTATDAGGPAGPPWSPPYSSYVEVTIRLNDVNEPPTMLHLNKFGVNMNSIRSVNENTGSGAAIVGKDPKCRLEPCGMGPLQALDVDAADGYGSKLKYHLQDANGKFRISSENGKGSLSVGSTSNMNFEDISVYTVSVTVTDVGGLSDTCTVTIKVLDLNERPTILPQTRYIRENMPIDSFIGLPLIATDPDHDQVLSYEIVGGPYRRRFKIKSCDGQLFVNEDVLDFEDIDEYAITVRVTDSGVTGYDILFHEAIISIQIVDVNEPPSLSPASFSIEENSGVGLRVGTSLEKLIVDDDNKHPSRRSMLIKNTHGLCLDSPRRNEVNGNIYMWSCDPTNKNQQWQYDPLSGQIKNAHGICIHAVNYKENRGEIIMMTCNELSLNQQWAYYDDTDEIKHRHSTFCLDAPERNVKGGRSIHMWTCNIKNKNQRWKIYPKQSHEYEIIMGNDGNVFTIDKMSGSISVETQLSCLRDDDFDRSGCTSISYEQRSSFLLYVRVTDNGHPNGVNKLSGVGKITIKVNDLNEAPRFLSQRREVDEQTPNRVPAVNYNRNCGEPLYATDEDGDTIRFNITDKAAEDPIFPFGIEASTGQVFVKVDDTLDFEGATNVYEFEVSCYDVSPGRESKSTRATITVALKDVNENPRVLESFMEIPEDFPTNRLVGKVDVVEVDAGQQVFRSLVSGNTNDAFRMVRDGSLYVMEEGILNFEDLERQHFQLVVLGRDTGEGALIHETVVTINVTNVNEPPWFPDDHTYTRQIVENSEGNTAAGNEIPSGDDDYGDSRTFSIDAGQGSGAHVFLVDTKVPILRLVPGKELNFEETQVYMVYVIATDAGGLSASIGVRLEVLDKTKPPR